MNKISCVICNEQADLECLIKDENKLFKQGGAVLLYQILDKGSEEKLRRFLQTVKNDRALLNWEINVIKGGEIQTVFFSGLFWMEKYFIQISSKRLEHFFYPHPPDQYDEEEEKSASEATETSTEKINEICRLNNELIDIQRVLEKKNRQLEQLNERLELLATTDSLTGIFNRRGILNRAEAELERAYREGQVFCVAILDLDDLKQINDTYGHQTGDIALRRVVDCLEQSTRKYETAGRIGGDEFLVYFSLENERQFSDILKRLLSKIEDVRIDVNDDTKLSLRASIGGVFLEPTKVTDFHLEELINQADKMLYQAKNDENSSIVVNAME